VLLRAAAFAAITRWRIRPACGGLPGRKTSQRAPYEFMDSVEVRLVAPLRAHRRVDAAGVKSAHMKLLKSVAAGRGPDGLRASLQLKMVVEGDAERAVPGRPRCRTASTDRQGVRGLEMTLLRGAAGTHGRTTRNLIPHRSPMCRHAWPIRRDCEDAPLSATHGAQGHSAFGRHPRERSPRQPSALRSPPRRERRGDGTVAIRRVL